jgi:tetratricopeptide (TPR) repeat protein
MVSYESELSKTRRDVALLQSKTCRDGRNLSERVRLAYRQFHLASLTEAESDYKSVQGTLDAVVREFGPQEDVCLLKANVEGRFHRLGKVREALEACPLLAHRHSGRAMLADVDFQEGRYAQAGTVFSELAEQNRTWDALARLAHWTGKMGDADRADRLYGEAEEELTAKEMRSYAWLELQRGALALSRGRLADARMHYERASVAFPGHWRTDEHLAALLVAEGDLPSAESLLRSAVTRSPRPESKQALGELLAMSGEADEARRWLDAVAAAFLSSVEEGGVHYFHHLADLYTDGLNQPAEAIRRARKDVSLRSNFDTQSSLAWALFKNGEYAEGLQWIRLALSSGARDRSMFAVAAALFHASGDSEQSEHYARAAHAINPNEPALHLHH